jgi:hypothetical protein
VGTRDTETYENPVSLSPRRHLSVYPHVYLALIHYPVYDKHGSIVATSITNFDIHDISRTAKTYEVGHYYLVTPLKSQQELGRRIIRHWHEGLGGRYNPSRQIAMLKTSIVESLETVKQEILEKWHTPPILIATHAKVPEGFEEKLITFRQLRTELQKNLNQPYLILFGTGYGLTESTYKEVDFILEPIRGIADYNHLSVRSAVAIILDRLLGHRDESLESNKKTFRSESSEARGQRSPSTSSGF